MIWKLSIVKHQASWNCIEYFLHVSRSFVFHFRHCYVYLYKSCLISTFSNLLTASLACSYLLHWILKVTLLFDFIWFYLLIFFLKNTKRTRKIANCPINTRAAISNILLIWSNTILLYPIFEFLNLTVIFRMICIWKLQWLYSLKFTFNLRKCLCQL